MLQTNGKGYGSMQFDVMANDEMSYVMSQIKSADSILKNILQR